MATKLRRLLVSLPPDVDAALARFSEVTGTPQSKFVVDCLRQNVNTLNTISHAVEAARDGDSKKSTDLLNRAIGEALTSAMSETEPFDSDSES